MKIEIDVEKHSAQDFLTNRVVPGFFLLVIISISWPIPVDLKGWQTVGNSFFQSTAALLVIFLVSVILGTFNDVISSSLVSLAIRMKKMPLETALKLKGFFEAAESWQRLVLRTKQQGALNFGAMEVYIQSKDPLLARTLERKMNEVSSKLNLVIPSAIFLILAFPWQIIPKVGAILVVGMIVFIIQIGHDVLGLVRKQLDAFCVVALLNHKEEIKKDEVDKISGSS